jgi:hypothetical protein
MKLDRFQEGSMVHLVFKAQPFTPTPNVNTQSMDMLLNIFSGRYHGPVDGGEKSFLFETEVAQGAVMWELDTDSVLMMGHLTNTSDIARVS